MKRPPTTWHFQKISQKTNERFCTSKTINNFKNEYFDIYLTNKILRYCFYRIANRLQLRSRSHNAPDGTRYIVIAKKLELTDLANEILNEGLRSKCYELISPTHPLPEKTEIFKKSLPPHLAQRKANKIGFNYKQQNSKLHSNSNQNPNGRFKPKQRKFFWTKYTYSTAGKLQIINKQVKDKVVLICGTCKHAPKTNGLHFFPPSNLIV